MNEYEHKFLTNLEAFRKVCKFSVQGFCKKIHLSRTKYYRWFIRRENLQGKRLYSTSISILTMCKLKALGFDAFVLEKQECNEEFERYLNDNNKAGEFFRALKYRLHYCDT